MRRLLPDPADDLTVEEAYPAPLGRSGPGGRPWIGLCMVASVDGSTVVGGTSGALSSDNDSAVLNRLRALADVIIVGAGTIRAEGYGPPSKSGQRLGVVTRSGRVDTSVPLFTSGAAFVITTEDADISGDIPGEVDTLRAGRGEVDLAAAIERLPEVVGRCDFAQCEGGPALNAAMAAAGLLDEIDLTISPGLVGGDGPRLTAGAPDLGDRYELAQLAVDEDSFLFTRWRRR